MIDAMTRRPFPIVPRGPGRRARVGRLRVLGCPRVASDWELGALRALLKPQLKGAILHRSGDQPWPRNGRELALAARELVRQRLGAAPEWHFPLAGDYHAIASYAPEHEDAARAVALLLSRRMGGLWFVVGRLFVRDGRFYRRERGYKLNLVPATNVHLARATRAALRAALSA